MFERFTERARQVVVLAQDEARALGHPFIGTEHLLLGLLREEEGLAAHVLEGLEVTVEEAREKVGEIVGPGEGTPSEQIPFAPRAKKVLELALREALNLRHSWIGTEHILLGLVREGEGVANRILLDFGADAERIRAAVAVSLGGRRAGTEPGRVASLHMPAPSGRVVWEYHVAELAEADPVELNRLGREGWELATAVGGAPPIQLIFKRRAGWEEKP